MEWYLTFWIVRKIIDFFLSVYYHACGVPEIKKPDDEQVNV